jgi:hypothetical protein
LLLRFLRINFPGLGKVGLGGVGGGVDVILDGLGEMYPVCAGYSNAIILFDLGLLRKLRE